MRRKMRKWEKLSILLIAEAVFDGFPLHIVVRRNLNMSRKSLQKNLSYDDARRLYYVTLPDSGRRRRTKTFRSYEEALRTLNEATVSSSACPGTFCSLGQWLEWWLRKDVSASRAASTLYARCV